MPGIGLSDHWSFWQEGYPAVMITDTALFLNKQYHLPGDTPEKLNYERMASVVSGLEQVIADLAGRPGE
ncbi:MAG: M28 family peptidase [Terriglobia bacterium]